MIDMWVKRHLLPWRDVSSAKWRDVPEIKKLEYGWPTHDLYLQQYRFLENSNAFPRIALFGTHQIFVKKCITYFTQGSQTKNWSRPNYLPGSALLWAKITHKRALDNNFLSFVVSIFLKPSKNKKLGIFKSGFFSYLHLSISGENAAINWRQNFGFK